MWVLGENCCISTEEELMSMEESRYVWIGNMYKGAGIASSSLQCSIELPLTTNPLNELFTILRSCMQHNFLPCLLMIGGRC